MSLVEWLDENFSTEEKEEILTRHELQTAQLVASIRELVDDAQMTIDKFWKSC
jgi:hypothetical protein